MKIFVSNFSGNVGKTLVAKHLITPKLNARRVTIESINSGGEGADAEIKAAQFKDLTIELMVMDEGENIVVDIGASNIESVMDQVRAMKSAESDFDFFVLPTTPDAKQQLDTISTARVLSEMGVPADRILVVMNRVINVDTIQDDFAVLLSGDSTLYRLCQVPILESEAYDRINDDKRDVHSIAADIIDFKAQVAANPALTTQQKRELANRVVTQRLASAAAENLTEVWLALGLEVTV